MYYMYVCYISLVHCYFKIIARERVCQTFWLSVRVFVKRLVRDAYGNTHSRKSISTWSFHVHTALSLSNSLPSFWKSVPGGLQATVMVSKDTPAGDTQIYIYLFVCIILETFVILASEACLGISATCPSSILHLHMSECVFCVCMHSVFVSNFKQHPCENPDT